LEAASEHIARLGNAARLTPIGVPVAVWTALWLFRA